MIESSRSGAFCVFFIFLLHFFKNLLTYSIERYDREVKSMAFFDRFRTPLDDGEIIELYFARNERAIDETDKKYRRYLFAVAYNILYVNEDCEECLNDTYIGAWGAMPPERPTNLKAFLTVIIRRISINRYNEKNREKRVPSSMTDSLDELDNMIFDESCEYEERAEHLGRVISEYLYTLSKRQRYIFMSRYYVAEPIEKIADEIGVSRSTVNKEIAFIKTGLRACLEKEGYKI